MTLMEMQAQVRDMLEDGVPFEEVEDEINAVPGFDEDERSALWLLAWSYLPKGYQREVAVGHLWTLAQL